MHSLNTFPYFAIIIDTVIIRSVSDFITSITALQHLTFELTTGGLTGGTQTST